MATSSRRAVACVGLPGIKDLVVNRSALDRVSGRRLHLREHGGSATARTRPRSSQDADLAFAACIGNGCVRSCLPETPHDTLTSAKVTHLGLLRRIKQNYKRVNMLNGRETGSSTVENIGEWRSAPTNPSDVIASLNRQRGGNPRRLIRLSDGRGPARVRRAPSSTSDRSPCVVLAGVVI